MALLALALLGVRAAGAFGTDAFGSTVLVGATGNDDCGRSTIAVDYDVDFDLDLQGYGVSAARLSGLDERCQGYDLVVTLNGPGGVPLAEMSGQVDATRMRVAVPVETPVPAEQLTGVSVVLSREVGA
ncbi:hypothetical protein [Actinotalea sp.]|uniref:hypothetical protein n=1 Tax=Actinotalea sp. TaxID=1872145 RepID=UPI003561F111